MPGVELRSVCYPLKQLLRRGCMFMDGNDKPILKVMGGETQKVDLTSETFQDDVFDHYLVVKNPTVSNNRLFIFKGRVLT